MSKYEVSRDIRSVYSDVREVFTQIVFYSIKRRGVTLKPINCSYTTSAQIVSRLSNLDEKVPNGLESRFLPQRPNPSQPSLQDYQLTWCQQNTPMSTTQCQ